ncbi:MAG: 50S ribosomal protein L44e [Promethearchaeota archaeon]
MKAPKIMKTYCARCKMHKEHTVSLYKKGRERALSAGRRRYTRKESGYGSQPKPIQKRFSKVTKKQSLRLKCNECGHITIREGIRLKKIELV